MSVLNSTPSTRHQWAGGAGGGAPGTTMQPARLNVADLVGFFKITAQFTLQNDATRVTSVPAGLRGYLHCKM